MNLVPDCVRSAVREDPSIMDGIPCIAGTRVPVFVILDCLACGHSISRILDGYPHLTEEQVKNAVAWASQRITPHGDV